MNKTQLVASLLAFLQLSCCQITEFWSEPRPDMNLYMDPNSPFLHGVTSGDPYPDSVVLWTRATPAPEEFETSIEVEWAIWERVNGSETSPNFSGTELATPERDFTVKLVVEQLRPDTTYLYRFYHVLSGNHSRLGRTRTAPQPGSDVDITFAVTSCTQHQMYLNVFDHLAYYYSYEGELEEPDKTLEENDAINAVIHLGDFIYDTNELTTYARTWDHSCDVNPELTRSIPNRDTLIDPAFITLGDSKLNCTWLENKDAYEEYWKFRHSENRMDPDYRAALAAHPWIIIIDSHDANLQVSMRNNRALEIFEMWTPVRWGVLIDPASGEEAPRMFRSFEFGSYVTLAALDIRNVGVESGQGLLGNEQRDFLYEVISNTSTQEKWRVLMTGKAFVPWTVDRYGLFFFKTALKLYAFPLSFLALSLFLMNRHSIYAGLFNREKEPKETNVKTANPLIKNEEEKNEPKFGRGSAKHMAVRCFTSKGCIRCEMGCCVILVFVHVLLLIAFSLLLGDKEETTGSIIPFTTETGWDSANGIQERYDLLRTLEEGKLADEDVLGNIFLSGDMHMHVAQDIQTGDAGIELKDSEELEHEHIGVEWLPSSTSSRNVDDFVVRYIPFQGIIDNICGIVEDLFKDNNPTMKHFDVKHHGIGYLHLSQSEANMYFYENDVFFPFRVPEMTWSGKVKSKEFRWAP